MRKLILTLPLLFSATTFADNNAEKQVVFKVEEMNCQLCAYLVNKEVRAVDGVRTTKASIKDRKVTVFAEPQVSNEAIVKAIEKLNYSAQLVE